MVLRKRVTTSRLAAIAIRSWLRQSLLTAATISGVRPGESAASASPVAVSESSQSRSSPTVTEVGVAEHGLDGAEIGAALEQMRREGVPQLVRREIERQIGERALRRDPFGGALRRDAGERVAGPLRRRLGQQSLQSREDVARSAQRRRIHAPNSSRRPGAKVTKRAQRSTKILQMETRSRQDCRR